LRTARERAVLLLILTAYVCYALAFIYRTSFVVDGVRYFALFDDAMISMRFAKNFAAGLGFVYNAGGPRVEGFTNPLWTVYMAAVHLLPIPAEKISLVIQLTGAACLAGTVAIVWRLALRAARGSILCAAAAACFTAFYLPLNNWTLQGFEVGPLALIVTLAVWRSSEALRQDRFDPVPYTLFAVATLFRFDALVPTIAVTAVMAFFDRRHRTQHLLFGVVGIGILTLAQTGARLAYFGYPFPNTYYLKMTGYPAWMRIARGALVLLAFVWRLNVVVCAAAALVVLARWKEPMMWLLATTIAAVVAYSVYVGGDAWEWWGGSNRYISLVMPLFFVLVASAIHETSLRAFGKPPSGWAGAAAVGVFAIGALLNFNFLRQATSLREFALIDRPFTVLETAQYVRTARTLDRVIDPSTTIAVVQAGTLPYFLGHNVIDMLGKNDVRIAHEPMHMAKTAGLHQIKDFFPGHMKWDFAYAVREEQPDVVIELSRFPDEALPYVKGEYLLWRGGGATTFYVRRGSPRLDWSALEHAGALSEP